MDSTPRDVELQQALQRFTSQFVERITQAATDLEASVRSDVRDEALRKHLLYTSSAIEICTGPFAEINLLDMDVFVRLSRSVLEKHWIPRLYGREGASLAEAFDKAEAELSAITARVLSSEQREQLAALVDSWIAENPSQFRVEGIRLADFSTAAGNVASDRAQRAQGLLSSVKAATHTANQAMLLTERCLFLVHRLPFVWRLQARLGAREILSDVLTRLAAVPRAAVSTITEGLLRLTRRGR